MSKKGSITTSDFLDYEEYKRLIDLLDEDRQYKYELYCVLSFALALRASDVRKLKWSDVLGERRLVVQEKKTKKTKPIPIGPNTSEKIDELYVKMGKPFVGDWIFTNKYGTAPVSLQYINRCMKAWKEKYGLHVGNISSHTFRKTFGRYVYNKMGRSEEAIILLQRIFRHTSAQTTMIYIGLRDDEIGDVFNTIDI